MRIEAIREDDDQLPVQPEGKEQQSCEQLREHQKDAGVGLGIWIDCRGVSVSRLQPEDLARPSQSLPQPSPTSNPGDEPESGLGKHPGDKHARSDTGGIDVRPS